MKTVLYFYPVASTFVRTDLEILKKEFKVRTFFFDGRKKFLTPVYFILQIIFLLYHSFSAKMMFSQFAGYHSFLPSIFAGVFGGRHYIVLNGTECNNFPEFGYGYLQRPILHWFAEKSMRWATKLLPVSESLVHSTYTYKETRFKDQGYKAFYKNVFTPYEVIYNGISPDRFTLNADNPRDTTTFITVATGLNSERIKGIKGLDLIIDLAESTPEYQYTFIGAGPDDRVSLPDNIRVIGFVDHDQLSDHYNAHAFYLQLSVSEGFGIAVCEAMLCGCVPIVSNVGILPAIAGNSGYVLEYKSKEKLLGLIEKARKDYNPERLKSARQHIINNFDISIRVRKLNSMLYKR